MNGDREDIHNKRKLLKLLMAYKDAGSRRPIESYKAHPKQEAFHKCRLPIRMLAGANRSGKSTAGLAEGVWTALGIHPYQEVTVPNKGWICGPDFNNWAASTMIPKWKNMIPKDMVSEIHKNERGLETKWRLKNGSVVEFRSYDQDPSSFESSDMDWVHFDEPPPRNIFEAAFRGLTDRGGKVWFTMTPIAEPWLFRNMWLPGLQHNNLYWSASMTIWDNPHLSKENIARFEAVVSEDYKRARLYGEFLELRGRVFKTFNRAIHLVHGFWPKPGWPCYMGVDPHVYGRKNQAALWFTVTPDGDGVFYDELWEDLTIEELRDKIIVHDFLSPEYQRVHIRDRVIDTSINVREALTHTNFRQIIQKPGIGGHSLVFRNADKKNLLMSGLEYINTLLTPHPDKDGVPRPRLYVDARCTRLIEEFELHGWKNSKDPETHGVLEKETNTYNDMISIARYIMNLNPFGEFSSISRHTQPFAKPSFSTYTGAHNNAA